MSSVYGIIVLQLSYMYYLGLLVEWEKQMDAPKVQPTFLTGICVKGVVI